MPTWAEALRAIEGSFAIARRDPGADKFFDLSADAFWRSFGAIIYLLPVYLVITLAEARMALELSDPGQGELPATSVLLTAEFLSLGLDWVAYPLVMMLLAPQFGLANRLASYIIVYNWSSLAVVLLIAPNYLLYATGILPVQVAVLLNLVLVVAILWFRWYLAHEILGAPTPTAIGFVVFDVLLSLLISMSIASLIIGTGTGASGG